MFELIVIRMPKYASPLILTDLSSQGIQQTLFIPIPNMIAAFFIEKWL